MAVCHISYTKCDKSRALSSAVEGISTNVIMADTKGNIVYMKPSAVAMFRCREQLRPALSSFNIDKIIGTNFDTFYKNRAHQQNTLWNPANLPFTADIKVPGLELNLMAITLKDNVGEHLGTAVE